MFVLENGRTHFYQWDLEQRLIVNDETVNEVHFCNRTDDCSLVCEVYTEGGKRFVNVPNILFWTDWDIRVYAYCTNHTKVEHRYKVIKRTKPADYVYTETEVKNFDALEERVKALEENSFTSGVNTVNGKAGNVVLTAADVGALPDDTVIPVVPTKVSAFTNDAKYITQSSLAGYYTKAETETAIETAIDEIPPTDLSNYYTKSQTNTAINNAKPDLSQYATKNDISDMATNTQLNNYYTKAQTNNAINAAKPDLTPYATKQELENSYYTMSETEAEIERQVSAAQKSNDATYAKKTEIPSTTGLATETYVNNAIAAIPKTDLTNYYTKTQTDNAINNAKPDLTPYAKKTEIEDDIEAALTEAKQSGEFDGEAGQRGTGILKVTTAPSSYTTVTNGIAPIKRMSIATIKTQSNVNEVLVGDNIAYSYYLYHVYYCDNTYAYMDTSTSIRGSTGKAGADGTTPVKGVDYWTDAEIAEVLAPYATKANSETWTFTLKDGTTVSKKVVLA